MASADQSADENYATHPGDALEIEAETVWESLEGMTNTFVAALPKLVIAVVVFGIFWLVALGVRRLIRKYTESHPSANIGKILGRLACWAVLLVGVMVAVGIVAPSVTPAKFLGALGIGGVAIGFAFKDILQNFLAGILILLRQPFAVGDQVVFGEHEGTVEEIDTRSTVIRTYDNRRVLIPNGQVYTNPMTVLTAYDSRRSQYDIGIGYGDDIEQARSAILEAVRETEGVLDEPSPQVFAVDLAGSSVNLRARWWTNSSETVSVSDRVITNIKKRLDDEAIDMPYPTNVLLFHDQTETTDGDRTRQREGWPVGNEPPKPQTISMALNRDKRGADVDSSDPDRNGHSKNEAQVEQSKS